MKNIIAVFLVVMSVFTVVAADVSYSTVAAMTLKKDQRGDEYQVVVQVSKLIEQDGKTVEIPISTPRMLAPVGQKASCFVGSDDPAKENVSVETFWPEKDSGDGFVSCTITVKREGQILSKSTMRLKMDK
jgi:hypothetical protein